MKIQLKKLLDLIGKADSNNAELERHKAMLDAAKVKRDKLIASGAVEDSKIRAAIADCDLDCRMLPHRIFQYEQAGTEIEKLIAAAGVELTTALADETTRLEELIATRGLKRIQSVLKPLGLPNAEALERAAFAVMNNLEWPGQLRASSEGARGITARSIRGYAEEMIAWAEAIEKFCA